MKEVSSDEIDLRRDSELQKQGGHDKSSADTEQSADDSSQQAAGGD